MQAAVAVCRDSNSHVCLRIAEGDGKVQFIAIEQDGDSLTIDVFTVKEREFYSQYGELLEEYPVRRAAQHYLNPLTKAITVSPRAQKLLESILHNKEHDMTDATPAARKTIVRKSTVAPKQEAPAPVAAEAPAKGKKTLAENNVEATKKASIKNTGSDPKVAEVTKDTAPKGKKDKGTWDKKETATESNAAAQKNAVKKHNEAKKKAAKKAARAAAREEAKSNAATTTNSDKETAVTTTKTAAKKTTAPAKKAAAKKAEPAAKKIVKKPAAPAKKAAPAKAAKAKGNGAGRPGKYTEDMKITVLVDNPKRKGSGAWDIFELLKKSKTVGEFYKKGGGAHNLRYNEEHEYIKVK